MKKEKMNWAKRSKIVQGILISFVTILGLGVIGLTGKVLDDKYGWVDKARDKFKPAVPDTDEDETIFYTAIRTEKGFFDGVIIEIIYDDEQLYRIDEDGLEGHARELEELDVFSSFQISANYWTLVFKFDFSKFEEENGIFVSIVNDNDIFYNYEITENGRLYDFSDTETIFGDYDVGTGVGVLVPVITELK